MSEPARQGERVLFEARASNSVAAAVLSIGAAAAVLAFVSPWPVVLFVVALLGARILELGGVVLRVRERSLEHRSISGGRARMGALPLRLRLGDLRPRLERMTAEQVDGLAWDGFDNVGIRLRDGSVEAVQFRHLVRAVDREPARRAILAFVERATGKPLPPPPEPALAVAPWVVRKPPHPLV